MVSQSVVSWIKFFYPMTLACALIYLLSSFLIWVGVYGPNFGLTNPTCALGFVSLLQIIGLPVLYVANHRGRVQFYLPYAILGIVWLLVTLILLGLILAKTSE